MPWCCCLGTASVTDFPPDPTASLPFAHGGPVLLGRLRASAEDFRVDEVLGYQATGDGEHVFLRVRKRELNTTDVARQLARAAGVRQVAVGFAGLKDRIAVTSQYFSIHLPGKPDPDWALIEDPRIEVLEATRHDRKIRRGSLRANRFELVLRDLQGDRIEAERQLSQVAREGVPNYFGPQRFGRDASNLRRADGLFKGQLKRPKPEQLRMLLSASRSYLFNRILATRVQAGSWAQALPGEVLLLQGSNRQFVAESVDAEIRRRVDGHDIHPSGLLPGEPGRTLQPLLEAAAVERAALQDSLSSAWIDGLRKRRAASERRPLRVMAADLNWQWLDEQVLRLTFSLPSGAYATSLVREIMGNAEQATPS